MDHPIYLYYKLKKIKITFFNTIRKQQITFFNTIHIQVSATNLSNI